MVKFNFVLPNITMINNSKPPDPTVLKNNLKSKTMTFDEIIQSNKPVLVDFFAEWCGPCKMMAPVLKEVKPTIGDTASIIKVDVDKNPRAANQYQIQGVPTLILFKNGKPLWRTSGVVPKLKLVEVIKNFTDKI
jgi:thioredoxin 1